MGVTMKSLYERPGKSPHNPASFTPEPAPVGPPLRFLSRELIEQCATYREACALAWKHRAFPGMTVTYLGAVCDLYQQHVSDYFHASERDPKGRRRRELPAHRISVVQAQLGNGAISQWLARDMGVRLVEEFFAVENSR
jgi:hypothetical protein